MFNQRFGVRERYCILEIEILSRSRSLIIIDDVFWRVQRDKKIVNYTSYCINFFIFFPSVLILSPSFDMLLLLCPSFLQRISI